MSIADLNSVIASFAVSGGCTLVQQSEAPMVMGRRGPATSIATVVTDVFYAPDAGGTVDQQVGGVKRPVERLKVWLRTEILPAVIEPSASDPWLVIVGGRTFQVVAVEEWTAGGFWVATVQRVEDSRSMGLAYFGTITTADAALSAAARGAVIMGKSKAYTPTRSLRLRLADSLDAVGLVWSAALLAPSNTVAFRGVDAAGESVSITPTSLDTFTSGGTNYVVAVLPQVPSPSGDLRIEVL